MPRRLGPVLALLVLCASPLFAAELRDLQPTLVDGHVEVSFQLVGAIDDGIMARIQSGLPTAFVYEVELLRDRKRWWDDEVAAATLEVVAMYNAVSQEYLVNFKRDAAREMDRALKRRR